MSPKKLSDKTITGQQGVNLVEKIVLGMQCSWNPTTLDIGIDGTIELCDPTTKEALNQVLFAQVKATSGRLPGETESDFHWLCREKDLSHWLQGNAPVLLIVTRPENEEAYWVPIKEYFADDSRRKSRRVKFDKSRNWFDRESFRDLLAVACPRDRGLYLAPAPQNETLLSNLLQVRHFAENIYTGQTEFDKATDISKALGSTASNLDYPWFPKSGTIFTFHDLESSPLGEICDKGTIDPIDSEHWANSDDPDLQKDFVRMLNYALDGLLDRLGVKWHSDLEYHYFVPTRDPPDRKVHYQGLQKSTGREVIKCYRTKDRGRIKFVRHSAFKSRFRRIEGYWYLELTPTYHFTSDGHTLDRYREEHLKKIKEIEYHESVRGQLVMWANLLGDSGGMDIGNYPYLKFGDLLEFDIGAGVDDSNWGQGKVEADQQPRTENETLPLFAS